MNNQTELSSTSLMADKLRRHLYRCHTIYQKRLNQDTLLEGIGDDVGKYVSKSTGDNLLCEINRNEFTLTR